jgi:hypothetical protein
MAPNRCACRLSLELATATKRHEIGQLLEAYCGAKVESEYSVDPCG